ncbi:TPM domain-containing protein [Lutibacter flavus]|uniref:TLP18.3, Psb32 and MOLO-1 founding protein of phosphatase n=1 Tax=Lutibacter flavus TaxID=691689 RepID=A0A238YB20_9FLAO|nr:TPM domain-containing protein [Lutibacter flavus]SNR67951.1 TLP18.3, Psb32 and MOLO-1 founding protein of phosphatase [Lutibacter flavus]
MSQVEEFLTAEQEQVIIKAIKIAEKNTSGEIRVHLEENTDKPPLERALEVFHFLKMDATELKNGVLIYIAVKSKKFAIYGDEGINKLVPENFWNSEKELMLSHFTKGNFSVGIELAILEVGEKLKEFFPYKSSGNNELSDEISKG